MCFLYVVVSSSFPTPRVFGQDAGGGFRKLLRLLFYGPSRQDAHNDTILKTGRRRLDACTHEDS